MKGFRLKLDLLLKAKSDFGLAICILWPKIPKEYLKEITLNQWLEIFDYAPSDSPMRKEVRKRILKLVDIRP